MEARIIKKFVISAAEKFKPLGTKSASSREVEITFKVDRLKLAKIVVSWRDLAVIVITGFGCGRMISVSNPRSKTILAAVIKRILRVVRDDGVEVVYRENGRTARSKLFKG